MLQVLIFFINNVSLKKFLWFKVYLTVNSYFSQCLVKGCHKRLRIVHTIEFNNGGADIQILRIAVYEEQWVGPANFVEDRYIPFNSSLYLLRDPNFYA